MKKLFFFILFMHLLSVYAMEDEKLDINTAFRNAVGNANPDPSPETLREIKKYLELGADINYTKGILYGEAAIIDAMRYFNKDLFNFLLEHNADINSCDMNGETPLYYIIQKKHTYTYQPNIKQFDIEKDFLKRGANPNVDNRLGYPLLAWTIKHETIDLVKLLIKYGAKINQKDKFQLTPLNWAIECRNFEAIEELCNMGTSLINIDSNNSNAFHVAVEEKFSKTYINLLITKSRFDSNNKEVDEQLKTTIKTALLAFNRLKPPLPKEIQFIIFSYLALNCLYDSFNKKLCQQLVGNKNAKNPLLTYTLNKVNCLEQILQNRNKQNKTALQLLDDVQVLYDPYPGDWYIEGIKSLLDVINLQQDRIDFMNGTVKGDNLVTQIYEHSKKLLLDS